MKTISKDYKQSTEYVNLKPTRVTLAYPDGLNHTSRNVGPMC